jgi:putative salt-induced outer membrane protein YdiY
MKLALSLFAVAVSAAVPGFADTPCATPTPGPLTGSVGAGFAHTSGNTDTTSLNASFALQYDPKTKNVVKASGLYLSARTEDTDTVDQTTLGLRDEYKLTPRAFVFGDVHYLRDQFKDIKYLITPLLGVGYQLAKTERTALAVDVAVGGAFEEDDDQGSTTSGAYHAGEAFSHKLSPTATVTQTATAVWKTSDSSDALYHFDVSLSTAVTHHSELKVTFIDDIKNKPATPTTKKADTAVVMAFVMKL